MAEASFEAAESTVETNHWRTLLTLARHVWPASRWDLRVRVVLALICLAGAKLINVTVPFFYKNAVDALSSDIALITVPVAMIVAFGGGRVMTQGFGELRDFLFARVGHHAQRSMALATFQHLHNLSLAFHLERQTGGLSRVIERAIKGVQFVLSFMLFNILPTLLEILLVTGILLRLYGWPIALVTVLTISGYIATTMAITNWRLAFRRRMNSSDSEANTKAIDSLLNYEVVKYFGNEAHEHRRYDKALASYEEAAVRSQSSLTALNMIQGSIIGIGLITVLILAAREVAAGAMTVGDFVLVNTYLIQLYIPLNFLGFVYREVKQSLVDMDKMFELLRVGADIQDAPEATALQVGGGTVEFDNVQFGYGPRRTVLKGISFTVPAGRTVAIVGPSGAGKSTISRLLFRFYDVTGGVIRIDGQDIRALTQASLRQAIGIVPQDTVLFNDTIRYNIAYGRPGAPESAIFEAAALARIHDFVVSLPDGYETMVGERGLKLSGGEKQRVAIARTILKQPSILLFDEATSALDSQTEREIQDSLKEVSAQRTTLVIAHRLSTVVDADEILVLKNGGIVERGRHEALLARAGEYAAMWHRQQEVRVMEEKLRQALAAE